MGGGGARLKVKVWSWSSSCTHMCALLGAGARFWHTLLTVWLPEMCSCGSTPIPERETELSDVREREFRRPERETELSDVRERESSGVHKPEVCGVWQATGGMPSLFSREHIYTTPLANSTPLVSACETSEQRMSRCRDCASASFKTHAPLFFKAHAPLLRLYCASFKALLWRQV
jgi:hypothetical protein